MLSHQPEPIPRKPEMMAGQMRPLVEEANTTAKDPADSRHQLEPFTKQAESKTVQLVQGLLSGVW